MAKRDYYEVLGVERGATSGQIKSAYRRLARKFHPDVNRSPDASDRFKEATEAYEVLCDPERRKTYDRFGHAAPQQAGFGRGAGAYTSSGPVNFDISDFFNMGNSPFMAMGLDEILEALRGGRGPGRTKRPAGRGADVEHALTLDFLEAIRGSTATLRLARPGAAGAETVNVKIPPGVKEGSRVRLRGKGAPGLGGPGDLYLTVQVAEHPYFRRDGEDIYVDLPISIVEASLGAKVDVPTIDGMTTVSIPPRTGSGRRLRLRGRGVPRKGSTGRLDQDANSRGDQYIVIKIVPPDSLSTRGKQLLEEFAKVEKPNPRSNVPWK